MGNYPAAQKAVDALLADFYDSPEIAKALNDIAGEYRENKRFSLAAKLYNWLTTNCPESQLDIWAYGGVNEYSANDAASKILNDIGIGYRYSQSYSEAKRVFQLVVDYWPDSQYAIWSQVGIIKSKIDLQQDATESINTLLNEYIGNSVLPHCICSIAQHYQANEKYSEAQDYFNYLLDYWPDNEQAMWAYKGLAEINVGLNNENKVNEIINILTGNLAHKELAPSIVSNMAELYREDGNDIRAQGLYQEVVNRWPGTKTALGAQTAIGIIDIKNHDFANARASVDKILMLDDFCKSQWITGHISDILVEYYVEKAYGELEHVYSYMADNWPEPGYDGCAQYAAAAIGYIGLDRDTEAEQILQTLLTERANHPELARAVYQIGEGYSLKAWQETDQKLEKQSNAHYQRAIEIWKQIVSEAIPVFSDDRLITLNAYYSIGGKLSELGEFEQAIPYMRIVGSNWTDQWQGWIAQTQAARLYKDMYRAGRISREAMVTAQTKEYNRLLRLYPKCDMADYAKSWLERNDADNKAGEE